MKDKKLVFGIGINDADYAVQKNETVEVNGVRKQKMVWICPYCRTWKSMLKRCYSSEYQNRQSTYKGCSVCEEWLTFSNFRAWMVQQDWKGKELDKDFIVEGIRFIVLKHVCLFQKC